MCKCKDACWRGIKHIKIKGISMCLLVDAGYLKKLVHCFNEVTVSGEISPVRFVLFVATDCYAASHFTNVS